MTNKIKTYRIFEMTTGLIHGVFHGTYESIWEVVDTSDSGDEIQTDYKFSEFMDTIAHAYQNHEDKILEDFKEWGMDFVEKIHFTGKHESPREYNFATDKLDIDVTIDMNKLNISLLRLAQNKDFAQFLEDNYKSRDGFWSFTPHTFADIYNEFFGESDDKQEQALGAVMSWYIEQARNTSDLENYDGIEYRVWEDWQGNGYGGLNYQTICWECSKPIDYDHDFECQNPDCSRFKKMEVASV